MNRMKRLWLAAPVLGLLGGCTSVSRPYFNTRRPVELGRTRGEDGRVEIYKLDLGGRRRDLNLVVRTERVVARPDLGLTVEEIDKRLARRKMLDPYQGLFVKRVREGGAADRAGVLPGDILVALNGVELRYDDQFDHVVNSRIGVENEVELVVVRGRQREKQLRFKFVPDARSVKVPSTRAIPLEGPGGGGPVYAGVVIGTLPAVWTQRIYGDNRPTVLVGGVYVGSPAYRAGIRTGDRILAVNGRYFESAAELKRQILAWGARREAVSFEVVQDGGEPFRTEVALEELDASAEILIPFVFDFEGSANSTEWDLGPFGWVASYEGHYRRSDSRDPNYERRFSCLLGLFRCTWRPHHSRTRLLWFVSF